MQIGVTVKNFPNPDRAVGGRCCISLLVKILQIHHAFNPPPQHPHSTRSFKNTLLKESTNSHGCVFLFVQSNLSVSDSFCWCLFVFFIRSHKNCRFLTSLFVSKCQSHFAVKLQPCEWLVSVQTSLWRKSCVFSCSTIFSMEFSARLTLAEAERSCRSRLL